MTEWGKYDSIAFSGDCGRVQCLEDEPLEDRIYCPRIKFNGKQPNRPTMAVEICRIRVEENNIGCLTRCETAKKIKKYLDSNPD